MSVRYQLTSVDVVTLIHKTQSQFSFVHFKKFMVDLYLFSHLRFPTWGWRSIRIGNDGAGQGPELACVLQAGLH